MKRPARVRGKGSYIAAGFLAGVLAAVLLVVSSTSKPPAVSLAAAHLESRSAASAAAQVQAGPVRKAAAIQPEVSLEKFPSPRAPSAPAAGAAATAPAYGCAAALAYLHAHAEPHFTVLCPAPAYNPQGGPAQAMTCVSHPPQCPLNTGVIAISDPCPTAYMNEAANSWIALGLRPGAMDPYGPSC